MYVQEPRPKLPKLGFAGSNPVRRFVEEESLDAPSLERPLAWAERCSARRGTMELASVVDCCRGRIQVANRQPFRET